VAELEMGSAVELFLPVVVFAERRFASYPESDNKSVLALSVLDDMTPKNIKTSMNIIVGIFIGPLLSLSTDKLKQKNGQHYNSL
jgi:hypothetical protein